MITRLHKHDSHRVGIFQTQNNFTHSFALRCIDCQKHIQWLSAKDAAYLEKLGIRKEKQKYISGKKEFA